MRTIIELPEISWRRSMRSMRCVAHETVALRKDRRMGLPDAVIWASARVQSALLVTRNTRDFPKDDSGIRAPYTV
jgi:predicted nucleic acid-binding protein